MSPEADAVSPDAVTPRECSENQRRCRNEVFRAMAGYDKAAQGRHSAQMAELSDLKTQVAEQRGKANGVNQERQAETAAHQPVTDNGQKSVVRELMIEALKILITLVIIGGLYSYFKRNQPDPSPAPPAAHP